MALGTQPRGKLLDYEQYIDLQLSRTRSKIKMTDVQSAVLTLVTVALAVLFVEIVLDHAFALSLWVRRLVFFGGLVVGGVYAGFRVVRPLVARVSGLYAARTIEAAEPGFKDGLITYLSLKEKGTPVPRSYMAAIEARAVDQLKEVDVEAAVPNRRVLHTFYAFSAIVIAFCGYWIFNPKSPFDSIKRAFLADVAAPTNTRLLSITPGDDSKLSVVTAGSNVPFSVDVEGTRPAKVILHYSIDGGDFYAEQEIAPGPNLYDPWRTTLRNVQRNIDYYLTGGDAQSTTYHVEVLPAPMVTGVKVDLDFPAYTGVPDVEGQEGGNVVAIEGTVVSVHATTSQPAKGGSIDLGQKLGSQPMSPKADDSQHLVGKFTVTESGAYTVKFRTTDGQVNPSPSTYDVKAEKDKPPSAKITKPGPVYKLPSNAKMAITVDVQDDFGVREVQLHVQEGANRFPAEIDDLREPKRRLTRTYEFDAARHKLKPGMKLQYWVAVRDTKEPNPNRTESSHYQVEIVEPAKPEEVARRNDQNKQDKKDAEDVQSREDGKQQPGDQPPQVAQNDPPDNNKDQQPGQDNKGAQGDKQASGQGNQPGADNQELADRRDPNQAEDPQIKDLEQRIKQLEQTKNNNQGGGKQGQKPGGKPQNGSSQGGEPSNPDQAPGDNANGNSPPQGNAGDPVSRASQDKQQPSKDNGRQDQAGGEQGNDQQVSKAQGADQPGAGRTPPPGSAGQPKKPDRGQQKAGPQNKTGTNPNQANPRSQPDLGKPREKSDPQKPDPANPTQDGGNGNGADARKQAGSSEKQGEPRKSEGGKPPEGGANGAGGESKPGVMQKPEPSKDGKPGDGSNGAGAPGATPPTNPDKPNPDQTGGAGNSNPGGNPQKQGEPTKPEPGDNKPGSGSNGAGGQDPKAPGGMQKPDPTRPGTSGEAEPTKPEPGQPGSGPAGSDLNQGTGKPPEAGQPTKPESGRPDQSGQQHPGQGQQPGGKPGVMDQPGGKPGEPVKPEPGKPGPPEAAGQPGNDPKAPGASGGDPKAKGDPKTGDQKQPGDPKQAGEPGKDQGTPGQSKPGEPGKDQGAPGQPGGEKGHPGDPKDGQSNAAGETGKDPNGTGQPGDPKQGAAGGQKPGQEGGAKPGEPGQGSGRKPGEPPKSGKGDKPGESGGQGGRSDPLKKDATTSPIGQNGATAGEKSEGSKPGQSGPKPGNPGQDTKPDGTPGAGKPNADGTNPTPGQGDPNKPGTPAPPNGKDPAVDPKGARPLKPGESTEGAKPDPNPPKDGAPDPGQGDSSQPQPGQSPNGQPQPGKDDPSQKQAPGQPQSSKQPGDRQDKPAPGTADPQKTGPKGEQGEQGSQSQKDQQGSQGGQKGQESSQGQKGEKGSQGQKGEQGGSKGQDGQQGKDGQGSQAQQGKDGQAGEGQQGMGKSQGQGSQGQGQASQGQGQAKGEGSTPGRGKPTPNGRPGSAAGGQPGEAGSQEGQGKPQGGQGKPGQSGQGEPAGGGQPGAGGKPAQGKEAGDQAGEPSTTPGSQPGGQPPRGNPPGGRPGQGTQPGEGEPTGEAQAGPDQPGGKDRLADRPGTTKGNRAGRTPLNGGQDSPRNPDRLEEDKSKPSEPAPPPPDNPGDSVAPDSKQQQGSGFVLRKIQDLLNEDKVTPDVEKKLGMSREQMEQFVKKYERGKPLPAAGPGREIKAKPTTERTFDPNRRAPDALPGVTGSRRNDRTGDTIGNDNMSGLSEGANLPAPKALQPRFDTYKTGMGRAGAGSRRPSAPPAGGK